MSQNDYALLKESFGVFDGCEELANEILDECENARETRFEFKPKNNKIANLVVCRIVQGRTSSFLRSSIIVNGKYEPMCINVSGERLADGTAIGGIMHELTHAYENLKRIENKAEDLFSNANKIGYFKNDTKNFGTYKPRKELVAQSIYLLVDFERNANIAGIAGELANCKTVFKDITQAYNFVKSTKSFKNFSALNKVMDWLNNINQENDQRDIVRYANELSEHNFRTYGNFLRWFASKLRRYNRKFSSTVPKIAARYLKLEENLGPHPEFLLSETLDKL